MQKLNFLITTILSVMLLLITVSGDAQTKIKVSGRLSDKTGQPVIGANVVIKGTTRGVTTDFDGQYSLDANVGETIQFTYLGMLPKEFKVSATMNSLDVVLEDNTTVVEDVVVVGYGVQKKQSVVGAISQVKSEDLMRTGGVTSVSNALTGLVPGLTTLNYAGKPGSDNAEIVIRAKSTWNGSSPLVLVDGIERDMNSLDVSEIENISVLKDASATAVFGVRGGNGVILVTTKRGKEGKPKLTASANVTLKTKSKLPENLGSYDALWLRNQAIENQLGTAPNTWQYITPTDMLRKYRDQTDPYMYPDVDWQDEMLRKSSWSQRYTMDVSGGTKFVKYYGMLGYTYDGDVIKGQDFNQGYTPKNDYSRYNYRVNLDFQPTKTTTFSVDLDGARGVTRTTAATPAYLWPGIYGKGPDQYPVRYEDGTFANIAGMYNPVEYFNYSGLLTEARTDINTTFSFNQKLDFVTEGLSFKATANFSNYYYSSGANMTAEEPVTKYVDWRTNTTTWNYPKDYTDKNHGFDYIPGENEITIENILTKDGKPVVFKNLMYQAALNYNRTFGKHRVTGLGMFKRIETANGPAFPTYREEWAARVTYDYGNRYLFEANGAYNGSEKFAKGNKFGFFPSAAVGWVVSSEPIFQRSIVSKYMNLLKFRYSWGKVGSDNNIPKWLYITQWNKINNSAIIGVPNGVRPPYNGYEVGNIGNPDARWETSIKNDFAVEAAFFDSKLSFTYDYYWGRRYDIFMNAEQRNIPPWFGADPVPANIGRTSEKGWELDARFTNTTGFGLKYYVSAMVSYAKDQVDYMEDPELTPWYRKKAGFQIGQQMGVPSSGVITSWDQMYNGVSGDNMANALPGMMQLVDYNGDGVVDTNDIVPYGYPNRPQYTMSFTAGAEWKGFSLMLQFYGTRNCTLSQSAGEFSGPNYYSVMDKSVVKDMWIPGFNDGGTYRHPTFMLGGNAEGTGVYHQVDGTQWRLKNAELAYRFSSPKLKQFGIENLRVFVNGNNIWLFSHLNEDRETGGKRDNSNIDKYPLTKRYNLGIKLEF